ncbi:MAG TPA: nucleotidyltransferase [Pyrinomonadaceae bacterium]|nr:nucleotidyltransferase [Pyrinomonadaceae bacterium]
MIDWEDTFQSWSAPPSKTEQEKSANAETGISKAVQANRELAASNVNVFAQGSYAANTNVRLDSDVDICVLCRDTFFFDLPEGKMQEHYGITPATFRFADYKSLLHTALVARFDNTGVTRGNKAFDVHSNTYRVDADAIPVFEYRYYFDPNAAQYIEGVAFLCDDTGKRIHNYPIQSLEKGRAKNERTGRRFKRVVRTLKSLRNAMQEEGVEAATDVASFLIESLVYHVSDLNFGHDRISDDVKGTLYFLLGNLANDQSCSSWTEVNEIKFLFRPAQPWTREQASQFVWAAIDYTGLK